MNHNELLERLENLIGIEPKQTALSRILGYGNSTIGNRAARNSEYSLEELFKLEKAYGLPIGALSGVENTSIDPNITKIKNLDDNTHLISIDKILLNEWGIKESENLRWIRAEGNSMHPLIDDENIIVFDISINTVNSDVYVFEVNGRRFVRQLALKMNGDLDIVAYNKTILPETIKMNNDVKIIGKVVKNLSRGL